MFIADLNIQRLLPQPISVAIRAFGAAPVTAEQHAVLNFIKILLYLFKKIVDPVNAPLFVIEQIKKCNDGQGETSNGDPNASLSSSF